VTGVLHVRQGDEEAIVAEQQSKPKQVRASTDDEVRASKSDDDEQKAAQDAQVAEAEGAPKRAEFDGFTYELREGQPSPRALTYVARWQVDDENMAIVLALREMLGEAQWEAWCARHKSEQLLDFWLLLNKVAGGGEGN
jgi:hypothetical protein